MKKGIICWLFFLFMTVANSQQPFIRKTAIHKELKHLKTEMAYYATDGSVLLATNHGVYTHNGILTKPFTSDTSFHHPVRSIAADLSQQLWIGYEDGRIAFGDHEKLRFFSPEEGLPATSITGFAWDEEGNMWFATNGEGLYVWTGKRMFNINMDDGLSDNIVHCIITGKDGKIYAGTDHGISICLFIKEQKIIKTLGVEAGLSDPVILSLAFTKDEILLAGSQDAGLFSYKNYRFEQPLAFRGAKDLSIHAIIPFDRGFFLATAQQGLLEYTPEAPAHYAVIAPGKIHYGCSDGKGNTWFGSRGNELNYFFYFLQFIKNDDRLNMGNITAVCAEGNTIWFAGSQGLFSLAYEKNGNHDIKQWLRPVNDFNKGIISIQASEKEVWIGTFGFGLGILDKNSGNMTIQTEANGLISNNILAIDRSGKDYWLATLGGAAKCSFKNGLFSQEKFLKQDGIGINFIYDVLSLGPENTWFATDGKGLTQLSGYTFRQFSGNVNIPARIYSLTTDAQQKIWFNSADQGLFSFDGKQLNNYGISSGLRDITNTQLACIPGGEILVARENGIDLLQAETGHFLYFTENSGLTGFVPSLNAIATDSNGTTWMGTSNGFVLFLKPGKLFPQFPLTTITGIELLGSPGTIPRNHIFSYNQNYLEFRFQGLWYPEPERVIFQVMLEGMDKDWNITKNNSVTYSNLPPGTYTFKIRATAGNHFEGAEIIRYSFTILQPFWKRWWFIVSAGLLLSCLVYALFKWRVTQLRKQEQLKKEAILFQLENLRSQVNPHFLFNSFNTLIYIIETDKETAIEYVEKLADFFRSILTYREKDLIELGEELTLLEHYIFLQKKRFGENLVFKKSIHDEDFFIPPLTLQMLVENAIKHNVVSSSSILTIEIIQNNDAYLNIRNNIHRKKIKDPSTGFGLENIKKKFALHDSRPVIIEENAFYFTVKIPLTPKKRHESSFN